MKKTIFTLVAMIATIFGSYSVSAETKGHTVGDALVKTVAETTTGVETVYNDAKGLVTTVYGDLKGATGELYPDVKAAVSAIASGIGVATEYVWTVLVKQFVVKGVAHLLVFLLGLGLIITGLVMLFKFMKTNDIITWKIVPGLIFMIVGIAVSSNVNYLEMLQGLINPAYGAIDYILNYVKTLK